jgi:hypothetical protein
MQVARTELGAVGNTSTAEAIRGPPGVGTGWLLPRPTFAHTQPAADERRSVADLASLNQPAHAVLDFIAPRVRRV